MYKAKHLPKSHLPHILPPHPTLQFLLPALPLSPQIFQKISFHKNPDFTMIFTSRKISFLISLSSLSFWFSFFLFFLSPFFCKPPK